MKSACFLALNIKRLRQIAIVIALIVVSSHLSSDNVFFTVHSIFAQNLPTLGGVAVNVEINDSDVEVGHIISVDKNGFKKSTTEYDVLIFGVVTNSPILSVEPRTDTTRAVISSGETQVRVSTQNGEIVEGDLITSSTTAGVGQKATAGGYVIGKALQGYSKSSEGLVSVLVGPSFGTGAGAGAPLVGLITNPANSRYILAALLGLVVAIGGTVSFIRLVSSGVTAIGRNPLARNAITRSMVVAGFVIAILAIAGAGIVVAIIRIGGS